MATTNKLIISFAVIILFSCSQKILAQQWTTNGNNISNTNSGNVGIGITTPDLPLDIRRNAFVFNGGARAIIGNYDQTPMAQGVGGGIQFGGKFDTSGTTAGFASISGIKENGNNNDFSSALVFTTRTNPNPQAERMRISSTGNVGIGTTGPGNLLHVNSEAMPVNTQFRITANGLGSLALLTYAADNIQLGFDQDWSGNAMIARNASSARIIKNAGKLTFSGNTGLTVGSSFSPTDRLSIDLDNGNVGIGTTTPSSNLHIVYSFAKTDTSERIISEWSSNDSPRWGLKLSSIGNATLANRVFLLQTHENGIANSGNLVLQGHGGNVGIGTNTPSKTLDVSGDINASGTITGGNIVAKYQDVAEWVPAARALAPGTVVTLNPTQSNLVEASSKAYDTRVAGVISAQPGITLGERSENKVLVATTGRVKVKVDATNAPIRIGDLLVTSEKEGVAMKSEPVEVGGVKIHRPGTIIGKALEPLAKGSGEILVLLSLQ